MSPLTRLGRRLTRRLRDPPAPPFRPEFWRSPLRGPWLTSVLGTLLIPLILVVAATGLISHWAYYPQLGHNATSPPGDDIAVLFNFPGWAPSWSYALTQGLHVTVGLIAVPIILAKLWSVIPKLFQWPAVKSVANALERLSLLVLVASVLVEFATGILNIEYWYIWHFDFFTIHYYGAWVFFAAFVLHTCLKMPTAIRAYRERGVLKPLRDDLAHTTPEPPDPDGLVPTAPAKPTISRRGLLAMVGGASLTILVVQVGESLGGPFRKLALLAPQGNQFGHGPNDFNITTTASFAGITDELVGPNWRLQVTGAKSMSFTREQLLAMPQHTYELPIACTEGWSTTQHWTGVRLTDLAALVGSPADSQLYVESVQEGGSFRDVTLASEQVNDDHALLALRVNGADLSRDHGYPARVIIPASPGVHCTKWVGSMRFEQA
jgi:DMSO/TMAO reductase YedYZ molybdopterin-dependent catalytic subunit